MEEVCVVIEILPRELYIRNRHSRTQPQFELTDEKLNAHTAVKRVMLGLVMSGLSIQDTYSTVSV